MNELPLKHKGLIYAALAVITFAAFEQVRHNDFVYYDDSAYIVENPNVNKGLSAKSVIWAFTSYRYMGHWHPLTWLSHILDCELFGLNPAGHHITSLLLHIANTLLLFWVFNRMTKAVWQSAFVAAIFAVHPLHVESVAWVAERKDVLSGLFWMLTLAAYILYTERPTLWKYLLMVLCFCLGLMAKSMLVTLPFVLLLLDYWPLNRFKTKGQIRHTILEKLPLLVPVVISSVMAYAAQQSTGTVVSMAGSSLASRIQNALVSYVSYICRIFYPDGLAVLYPRHDFPLWQPIVALLILAAISIVVFYTRLSKPYLVIGWLWFLGTFVPVIGLVTTGGQAIADRYTYLPSIGISVMAAWGIAELFPGLRYQKSLLAVSAGAVIFALVIHTRTQVLFWRDSETLFEHTLAVTECNPVINNNLGVVLAEQGKYDLAVENYLKAIRYCPDYAEAYNNLAIAYSQIGRYDEVIQACKQAIKFKPDYAKAHYNLGSAYSKVGRYNEAIEAYMQAIKFEPDYAQTYCNLARLYDALGRRDEAIQACKQALKVDPAYADAADLLDRIQKQSP
jgi:Tfp pilus assembly protein PilF